MAVSLIEILDHLFTPLMFKINVDVRGIIPLLADDPALLQELQLKRWLITLTVVGMSFVLLGLQGWLAWRLLRPDVRARFH